MRQVLDCCNDFTNLYSSTMILTLVTQPNRNKHVSYESCMHCQPGLINVLQTHCTNCLILLWAFSSYTVLNSKIQGSERLWGGEWHLGNTPAPAACLLSCLIHSLYHLIRRMWRCGGEALSPWDRKGGAVLHLLLPWPGSLFCLLAARVANIAPGWRSTRGVGWGWGGARCYMSTLHQVTRSAHGFTAHEYGEKWGVDMEMQNSYYYFWCFFFITHEIVAI